MGTDLQALAAESVPELPQEETEDVTNGEEN